MTEDPLLREIGQLAREEKKAEEARLDERWDRLAAGTLTAAEDEELRVLAATSPEAREVYEAFQPLGADFQARVVNVLAGELEGPAPNVAPREPRRLLPFRPATFRLAGWLTAAAGVAASLLLLLRGFSTMPPLPVYTAELSGGVRAFRGEPGPSTRPLVFAPGSTLSLVVRPEHTVTGDVEARAFLAQGAEIVPWEPEPRLDISANGVVRLQGTIGREIKLQPGPLRVWIVVGWRGKIPRTSELMAELRAGLLRDDHWQAVAADLRVEDQPPP